MRSDELDGDRGAKEVSDKLAELKSQAQGELDKRAQEATPPPEDTKDEEESSMSTTHAFQDMSGPQQVAAFNAMASRAKRKGLEVTPVKRFKNHKIGVERLNKLEARLATAGAISPAKVNGAKKPAKAARARAAKAERPAKQRFGHDLRITAVADNPRFKGTNAHKLYEAMAKYVAAHKSHTVAEVFENTIYRRQDFEHDRSRKSITVSKVK